MKSHFFHIVIIFVLMLATHQATAVESKKQITYFQKVVKTAKERLGKKAADNQRVNNCKVPITLPHYFSPVCVFYYYSLHINLRNPACLKQQLNFVDHLALHKKCHYCLLY